jgi:hypothetical protein
MGPDFAAVGRGDPATFLAAMLQGVEPEIGHIRGFRVTENPENAAFFVKFVKHKSLFPALEHAI